MKISFSGKEPLIGFAVTTLFLLSIAFASYRSLNTLVENEEWVNHTQQVLLRLERMISLLKDAQTGQRGFLLTGEERFLEPYQAAQAHARSNYRILDSLTRDNSVQQQRLDTLGVLLEENLRQLEAGIRAYRTRQDYQVAGLRDNKAIMDQTRRLVERLQAEELRLLAERTIRRENSEQSSFRLILFLIAAALLVSGTAIGRLLQNLRRIQRAEAQTRQSEQTLQSILDASPDGITVYRPVSSRNTFPEDFELVLVNPATERMLGQRPVLASRLGELFPDSWHSGQFGQYVNVMQTGAGFETEFYSESYRKWYRLAATRAGELLLVSFSDITERKRLEQSLLDIEQRKYEAVFNQNTQFVGLLDGEGRFLDVNQTAAQFSGLTRADFIGQRFGDSPAWSLPGVREQLREAIRKASRGETIRYDTQISNAEGEVRHVDLSIKPVYGEDRQLRFLLTEGRDITGRVLAEQRLYENNQQLTAANEKLTSLMEELHGANQEIAKQKHFLEQITSTTPNAIYIFDLQQFKTVYVNRDIVSTLGYTPEETYAVYAQGPNGIKSLIHPDDYERRTEHYRNFGTARDGEVREVEFRMKHADGNYRCFLVRNAVFKRTSEGAPCQIIGISQDITQLKETEIRLRETLSELHESNQELAVISEELRINNEELAATSESLQTSNNALYQLNNELETRVTERTLALQESNRQFQLLLESIPTMAWTALPDGSVNYYNGQWYSYLNTTFDQIKEWGWRPYIHPDDLEPTVLAWQQALSTGEPITMLRNRWKRAADGTYRWHLVRAVPLRNEAGVIVLWVGTNTDVHEQLQQQEQLEANNRELMRVNGDLDTFVYTASHDLKHPVVNLEGILNVLGKQLGPKLDERNKQWLDLMAEAVKSLKRTIQDLTEISRIQRNVAGETQRLDFSEVLQAVQTDLQGLITQTEARIDTDFGVRQIQYPASYLRSIIYNLLSNALKYRSPDRPARVKIRTCQENSTVVLSVEDNGLGLTPDQQAKLFTMFKRLHDHVEGTGVGLYMIKRMVENCGGRIGVASEPGRGSTFSVYFTAD